MLIPESEYFVLMNMVMDARNRICTNIQDYIENIPVPPGDWSDMTHDKDELTVLVKDIDQLQSKLADIATGKVDTEDIIKASYITLMLDHVNMLSELMQDMIYHGINPVRFNFIRKRRSFGRRLGIIS